MSFGNAFLDRSSGLHGSDERGGCTMPGGVGGVEPGALAPPEVDCSIDYRCHSLDWGDLLVGLLLLLPLA